MAHVHNGHPSLSLSGGHRWRLEVSLEWGGPWQQEGSHGVQQAEEACVEGKKRQPPPDSWLYEWTGLEGGSGQRPPATIAVGPGKTAEAREWQGWQSPLVGVSLVIEVKARGGGAGRSERKEDEYLRGGSGRRGLSSDPPQEEGSTPFQTCFHQQ